ncbi:L-threonylcarbamoyladenylate synthase [Roseospira navarrensis]|uniref:Threonylcarbamoyl-AMP synthase n=1 Tax=Roseospira navarrensis TaxID=140058 RepID=A0A7X1ZE51_9PROT|nr:L-threonylcarbamoyladenylate synthase [Roseospira navarrensis]MQX36883.1 threonylcarbamoyl-AMP synthase [Roseospira navarrensis]
MPCNQPTQSRGGAIRPPLESRPADSAALEAAAHALRAGRLVAFPTETVYGLGADARSDAAVAAIYAAKGRPARNPVIVHVPDLAAAESFVEVTAAAEELARLFWPGPLTLVLRRRPESRLCARVSAGGATVAIRAPAHPVARELLRRAAIPVAAPSANRSGAVSPTTAAHVAADLGAPPPEALAMILDGGPCPVGVESTVLDLSGPHPRVLRPGGITRAALEEALGGPLDSASGDSETDGTGARGPLAAPGMLSSHYAPSRPVRLDATGADPGEALLGFGGTAGADLDLSPAGDLDEAARNLFAMLRALDVPPHRGIAVAPVPTRGLGQAINDRLSRAAAPRTGDVTRVQRGESK